MSKNWQTETAMFDPRVYTPDDWRAWLLGLLKEVGIVVALVGVFYLLPGRWQEAVETVGILFIAACLGLFVLLGVAVVIQLRYGRR
jgi:hypothetical protein